MKIRTRWIFTLLALWAMGGNTFLVAQQMPPMTGPGVNLPAAPAQPERLSTDKTPATNLPFSSGPAMLPGTQNAPAPFVPLNGNPSFANGSPGPGLPPFPAPTLGMGRLPVPPGYAMPGPGAAPGPVAQMGFAGPPMGNPMGNPMIAPASHVMGPALMGGAGFCPHCQGEGCPNCMPNNDFDLSFLKRLLPYGEGGICAPRWYDFFAEGLLIQRDDAGDSLDLTSDGPRGNGLPNIALGTDNLEFDDEYGLRIGAVFQMGLGGSLEATWTTIFEQTATAEVTSGLDELYSVFSDYGSVPAPPGPPNPLFGGYTDTDNAELHRIDYSTDFDAIELNFRKRWVAPNCRIHGSWLLGVKYFQLTEGFRHTTLVDYLDPGNQQVNGFLDYNVETLNAMTGFQTGGDLWVSVIPGVRAGGSITGGIYGNHAKQNTRIDAMSFAGVPITETSTSGVATLMGQANFGVTWRVNYHWTARVGYELMYIEGVALAPNNFNTQAPFGGSPRDVRIDTDGNLFYTGGTASLEFTW
ncbi:MAG: hypothetical protein MK165_09965 [Pirellulaceae bacterium]|nr:hypothetical protein [Pirellulaceae bacterium]